MVSSDSASPEALSVSPFPGSITPPAMPCQDHGEVGNSSPRPWSARSADVSVMLPVAHTPARAPSGCQAVPPSDVRFAPTRSRCSAGRPSVWMSTTPDNALPYRAENPPLEKYACRSVDGSSTPNIEPFSVSNLPG